MTAVLAPVAFARLKFFDEGDRFRKESDVGQRESDFTDFVVTRQCVVIEYFHVKGSLLQLVVCKTFETQHFVPYRVQLPLTNLLKK